MIITKEQVSSILSMMESSDSENHYIAFKAIEGFDFSGDNMGYLIFLFKFSKYSSEEWSINAPEEYSMLKRVGYPMDHLNLTISLK